MIRLSPELRLLWAPAETYREMAARGPETPSRDWRRAVVLASTPAVVAGTATAVAATGRITWSLALSGALCWSLVALLQILTAVAVIAPSRRRVDPWRALGLFFAGHAAWSVWLLAAAAFLFLAPSGARRSDLVLLTAWIPLLWTAVIVFAYFRQVLQLAPGAAAMRTAIHQALTCVLIVLYVGWAVQLWPRLLALQAR